MKMTPNKLLALVALNDRSWPKAAAHMLEFAHI